MLLTKEEAISVVLRYSENEKVSGRTKLNKLLARLNLRMIPVDIAFHLNRYGSYSPEVEMGGTGHYEPFSYQIDGTERTGLKLTSEGERFADSIIEDKLSKIASAKDLAELKQNIFELSQLRASDISAVEHKDLLVDEEDRHLLIHRINEVAIDLLDLHDESKQLSDNPVELRLGALIDYCYVLAKFLKEKAFKRIESAGYDIDANMYNYYFLYILEKKAIPFMKAQLKTEDKDAVGINGFYQYFVNFARSRHPFSLDNKDLKELMA